MECYVYIKQNLPYSNIPQISGFTEINQYMILPLKKEFVLI